MPRARFYHELGSRNVNRHWKDLPVDLSDDVVGDTILLGVPSGRDLTSNDSVKFDSLGNKDPSTLSELDEPLARLLSPDVTLVAVLVLVLLRLSVCGFERLQVVDELDFLVEDLLRIVATE